MLTPHWLGLGLLALAIATVMSVLGVWQLDVYQSKTAAATAKRAEGAPIALQSLFSINDGLPSKAVGRRVTVEGTWGPAADQLFITDRRFGDRDGFWVVMPLILTESGTADGTPGAAMIIRGWVPSVSDPAATPPSGQVSLTGAIAQSEAQDASGDAAKGRTLQSLRIPTIVDLVDYRVYDAFVVLSSIDKSIPAAAVPSQAPAIVPAPAPPTDHAGLRNVAYAFQWWIFAAFTLWMWGRMVLDAHRSNDSEDADQPDDELEPSGTVSA
ncbi:SURF1 family protein [Kribbella sp. CA-293567]|uniref:SURF1 family protein n=1 Tax=Kribbella sp. CA-293567 TaxID=3002436 RepID=UPI0022DDF516|nr:SURF1 family protein [Kribbella sp. CA-293567]WBQ05509.1 SURF1 family protein [Kribbella sp. CA-293567]